MAQTKGVLQILCTFNTYNVVLALKYGRPELKKVTTTTTNFSNIIANDGCAQVESFAGH